MGTLSVTRSCMLMVGIASAACGHAASSARPATPEVRAAPFLPAGEYDDWDETRAAVEIVGSFGGADLDAIWAAAKRETNLEVLSIVRHGDEEVEVTTGSLDRHLEGFGETVVLRKLSGRWTVVSSFFWFA